MMAVAKDRWCAFCGRLADGVFSIDRDDFGEGPEVDLCNVCGGDEDLTCETIWARISMKRCRTHEGLRQVCSKGTVGCIVEHPVTHHQGNTVDTKGTER
jgi:hypothetical protein